MSKTTIKEVMDSLECKLFRVNNDKFKIFDESNDRYVIYDDGLNGKICLSAEETIQELNQLFYDSVIMSLSFELPRGIKTPSNTAEIADLKLITDNEELQRYVKSENFIFQAAKLIAEMTVKDIYKITNNDVADYRQQCLNLCGDILRDYNLPFNYFESINGTIVLLYENSENELHINKLKEWLNYIGVALIRDTMIENIDMIKAKIDSEEKQHIVFENGLNQYQKFLNQNVAIIINYCNRADKKQLEKIDQYLKEIAKAYFDAACKEINHEMTATDAQSYGQAFVKEKSKNPGLKEDNFSPYESFEEVVFKAIPDTIDDIVESVFVELKSNNDDELIRRVAPGCTCYGLEIKGFYTENNFNVHAYINTKEKGTMIASIPLKKSEAINISKEIESAMEHAGISLDDSRLPF